jgi:hypothetical protein
MLTSCSTISSIGWVASSSCVHVRRRSGSIIITHGEEVLAVLASRDPTDHRVRWEDGEPEDGRALRGDEEWGER